MNYWSLLSVITSSIDSEDSGVPEFSDVGVTQTAQLSRTF